MTRKEANLELETMLAKYAFDADEARAIGVAVAALCPVSREQIEKVWRGEWIDCSNGWMCSRCEYDNTYAKPFCPACGAPMTDEAVSIVMERLEALYDTEN